MGNTSYYQYYYYYTFHGNTSSKNLMQAIRSMSLFSLVCTYCVTVAKNATDDVAHIKRTRYYIRHIILMLINDRLMCGIRDKTSNMSHQELLNGGSKWYVQYIPCMVPTGFMETIP